MTIDLLNELSWRGMLKDCTDESGLRDHLAAETRRVYTGFDPTSDSLTIGNLVPIMGLVHVARAGHEPIVVMGGGTGLIGDPSGKSAERQLMTPEMVQANVDQQRGIFERVFAHSCVGEPRIVNNYDWLKDLSYIEALRDVGKHFSVNTMMRMDSIRDRLENRDQGISYTEFSYALLQAYDFKHLYEDEGVTVQAGGSDQWGNIVAGIDLIRRWSGWALIEAREDFIRLGQVAGRVPTDITLDLAADMRGGSAAFPSDFPVREQASDLCGTFVRLLDYWSRADPPVAPPAVVNCFRLHTTRLHAIANGPASGMTFPLVTKADGGKFGKTESGAIWLTAPADADNAKDRTSAYAMHQFWLNTSDDDVKKFLRIFTLLSEDEIRDIESQHEQNPGARSAQRALANEATMLVHGVEERDAAERAGKALFSGDLAGLPERTLMDVLADVPSSAHEKSKLAGDGADLIEMLIETQLAKSKREAREFISGGSVSINGEKIGPDRRLTADDLLHGRLIAIRRGKRSWHVTNWS